MEVTINGPSTAPTVVAGVVQVMQSRSRDTMDRNSSDRYSWSSCVEVAGDGKSWSLGVDVLVV